MKPTVPFVHQLNDKNALAWLKILQSTMPNINICLLNDLHKSKKDDIEVAIVANPNPNELLTLPNLKWIQSLWAGVEQLLKTTNNQVSIVRLVDPKLSETMAEAVLAWTMYLYRDMPLYAKQQVHKIWKQHSLSNKKTVGILGMGELGQKAANRLQDNGFDILGWNRNKQVTGIKIFTGQKGLIKIAERSDILIVLLPLTPQTEGLLGEEFFSHIKHGASLINFARSKIINTQALLKNLSNTHIKHAVLDVFENEPLPKTDPLWNNPNITILPHISAPTDKYSASYIVAKNLKKYFDLGKIPQAVSKQIGY